MIVLPTVGIYDDTTTAVIPVVGYFLGDDSTPPATGGVLYHPGMEGMSSYRFPSDMTGGMRG